MTQQKPRETMPYQPWNIVEERQRETTETWPGVLGTSQSWARDQTKGEPDAEAAVLREPDPAETSPELARHGKQGEEWRKWGQLFVPPLDK